MEFLDTLQVVRPDFSDIMLIDPVQVVFLPDTKRLESELKKFLESLLFFLGFFSTRALGVKIPVPVHSILSVSVVLLAFATCARSGHTFSYNKEGGFLRRPEAYPRPAFPIRANIRARAPAPEATHLPCRTWLQTQMHLNIEYWHLQLYQED